MKRPGLTIVIPDPNDKPEPQDEATKDPTKIAKTETSSTNATVSALPQQKLSGKTKKRNINIMVNIDQKDGDGDKNAKTLGGGKKPPTPKILQRSTTPKSQTSNSQKDMKSNTPKSQTSMT